MDTWNSIYLLIVLEGDQQVFRVLLKRVLGPKNQRHPSTWLKVEKEQRAMVVL